MPEIRILFDQAEYDALNQIAETDERPVEDIVRRAANLYLARRCGPQRRPVDGLGAVLAEIQATGPTDLEPAEIEAEARTARGEVRQARRATRSG